MKEFIEKLIGRLEEGIFSKDERLKYDAKTQKHLISQNMGIKFAISIVNELAEEYKGKYVRIGTLEQFKWERDVAIEQLKELGYGFGQKVGWIPTKEMLFPRYGQKVLASIKCEDCKHEIIITKYERQEYWHNGIITAWMPLPEPYKEGGAV